MPGFSGAVPHFMVLRYLEKIFSKYLCDVSKDVVVVETRGITRPSVPLESAGLLLPAQASIKYSAEPTE